MWLHLALAWYTEGMAVVDHFKSLHILYDIANQAGASISEGKFYQTALMTFPANGILGTVVMTLLTC